MSLDIQRKKVRIDAPKMGVLTELRTEAEIKLQEYDIQKRRVLEDILCSTNTYPLPRLCFVFAGPSSLISQLAADWNLGRAMKLSVGEARPPYSEGLRSS